MVEPTKVLRYLLTRTLLKPFILLLSEGTKMDPGSFWGENR